MCIIAVKKEGVNIPKDKTIKKMFESNSDGAGFMIKKKSSNKIILKKGFMELTEFMTALKSEEINQEDIVVMHFRIATVGGKSQRLTHPFVVDVDADKAEVLNTVTEEVCFAHNGTLSSYTTGASATKRSDSSLFGSLVLTSQMVKENLNDGILKLLINSYIGSTNKLAIINPKYHDVHLFGEWSDENRKEYKWNEDKDGMVYSNFTWETSQSVVYYGFDKMYVKTVFDYDDDIQHRSLTNSHVGKKSNAGIDDKLPFEYDDSSIIPTQSKVLIKEYIRSLDTSEYENFLDYSRVRKSAFEKRINEGSIGLNEFLDMYDKWMNWYFGDVSVDEEDDNIEYKSGVIVTGDGAKNLTKKKDKSLSTRK